MTIVGPGRRGVLVATADPARARRDREWLEDAGIPAAVPAELGLRLKGAMQASAARAEHEAGWRAEAWSRALRRPAVESVEEGEVYVAGATWGKRRARGDVPDLMRRPIEERFPPRVAVFGGAWIAEDQPEYGEALALGRRLAEARIEVITGGYQGIMAAASRGAAERASGLVVGVTIAPWSERVDVNEWLSFEVEAADLFARLPLICDADAWVAFPGGVGTLSEIALCWSLVQTNSVEPRPLVIVGERWDQALRDFRELLIAEDLHFDLVRPAATAERAIELLGQILHPASNP
ncbi:MAG TPA: LOG family protein [Actinomycetota bacterium]|nr:LOG family protein [Actinomycetota bacterium]